MNEEELAQNVGLPFQPAPLELIVHNAAYGIQHVQVAPDRTMTILQAFTPAFTITLKMDEALAENISNDLRPSPIQIARVVPQ